MKYLGKVLQKERLMISIQETLRVGTPRQGMNELCTKSWLPLANVGSSVLHRPRRLYLKRVKLLLSVLKHEFLEVLVISRHGSNSCWKPRAVCHWALGGLCHSRVSNEVLKVPDLGDENTTALLLKFPHEADFRWNVFYTERTEVSEWRVCWGGPVWLCPHSTALEAALFGLPASAWHCCWSCPGSAGSGTFRKLSHSLKFTVKLLRISIKHGVSAGLCGPRYFVLNPFISC